MTWRGLLATILIASCILAGCTHTRTSGNGTLTATLTVHIGLFGGPAKPDGEMALSNSPADGENVTALDARGGTHLARTDATGTATMPLAPGKYSVFSTYCGTGPQHIELTAHRSAHVQIDCPTP
jgi:hypothetical protein